MESKDWLTFGGLAVTLGLGIYNLYTAQRSAQRASIVGAVTAQRLKWGAVIQDLVGSFCAAAYYCRFLARKDSDEERKKIEEIVRLRHLIPVNLCERTWPEQQVEELVARIFSMSSGRVTASNDDFQAALLELLKKTQDLLHDNWQSIALEAQRGIFTPREGA